MNELQKYIEDNLPDRFRNMKVFRIPVMSDSVLYWASYSNGKWEFTKSNSNINPVLVHNSQSKYGLLYGEDSQSEVNESEDIYEFTEDEDDVPKRGKKVKEKPVKEKPSKERPVKEKPVREKPVREKPNKKEKPVRERPVRNKPEMSIEEDSNLIDINDEFDTDVNMRGSYSSNSNYSFVKDKVRKKLTGRIIFSVLFLILSGFSTILTALPVITNSSKANKNINNPVEYWHYRSKSGYLHALNVLSVLTILSLLAVIIVVISTLGFSLSDIPQMLSPMIGG